MKKLLIAAAALIFSSALTAQQAKFDDHVKFKATEHDFGKIKVGVPVTYDFAISNVGKTPVVVESATASCGCTTPVKPEQPIMAGDANKITAGFNAAAPGPFTKTITIKLAGVEEVSAASNIPGRSFNQNEIFESTHPENDIDASELVVDHDFLKVLNISLAEGRDFLRENPADADHAFLINETTARNLQLDHPVGKQITWERDGDALKATVIGVVKDFNFQSLHHTVKPLLIKLGNNGFNYIVLKLNTNDFNKTIKEIEGTWKKFDNRFTFEFFFLADNLNQQYRNEQNINRVIIAFSGVAILIACFGLLGIAALTFRNKTKEISVRKVLGAEFRNLVFLLLKDFTILILIAVIIATPVVIWIMQNWLQNFAYRVTLNPIIFIGAGMFLILLSWITLGYLTLTMARINPATTLKSE